MRMAQLVYYSFYKNIAMITGTFWWGLYSAWSAQVSYQEDIMTGYNLAITALPPFFLCIFEKDISEEVINKVTPPSHTALSSSFFCKQFPEAYFQVRDGRFWNWGTFFSWMLGAVYHSVGTALSCHLALL